MRPLIHSLVMQWRNPGRQQLGPLNLQAQMHSKLLWVHGCLQVVAASNSAE